MAVCCCQRGFGAAFSSYSLLAQNRQGSSLTILRSSVLLIFASGCFGVVFVNPLFAQFHPDLLHLPATVKSLRVMCLKNLLCLLPTGCFKGNNSVTAFMMFLGTEGRLACVCVPAFRPTTDPRHRHARTCAMTARCACKKRTRRPCHRRSRRVSPLIAVRVGEATHPGPVSTKHLRRPHCRMWLSHRSSLRNHILRFHEPPPPTSSPVLSEWSCSEADKTCLVLSCLVLSCLVLSCLVLSCLVLSCFVVSCRVVWCGVVWCVGVCWRVLACSTLSAVSLRRAGVEHLYQV